MGKHFKPSMPAETLTKVGTKFYYNQIELRGKMLALRERIVGVRKRGRMNVWSLSCASIGCDGVCCYASGYDKKTIDYDRCASCKSPEIGNRLESTIDGTIVCKKITSATWDTVANQPKYYVSCAKCGQPYAATEFTQHPKRDFCAPCYAASRTMHGHVIVSDELWKSRHLIRGCKLHGKKIPQVVNWLIDCSNGCGRTCGYRPGRQMLCSTCRIDARFQGNYEALYKTHLRQNAIRLKRQPNHPPSELTREQFMEAMKDLNCYYCGEKVPRFLRSKHVDSEGRRQTTCVYLDRLDSNMPYRADNIATCCVSCNITKGAYLTETEMLMIAACRNGNSGQALRMAKILTAAPYAYKKPTSIGSRNRKPRLPKP